LRVELAQETEVDCRTEDLEPLGGQLGSRHGVSGVPVIVERYGGLEGG
jgi:hypothetical protein